MAKVADRLWEMLHKAGVKRCYGIVGDALNPVIDALRRNGNVEFIHVRNEEYGVFAAVAESYLTGNPVAVCGTAGPGVTHLFNGLMDARKERASVIAIAGDVESKLIDTSALEELNRLQRWPGCRRCGCRSLRAFFARARTSSHSGGLHAESRQGSVHWPL
jgi:pyruvate dehydrogenase (quinone)